MHCRETASSIRVVDAQVPEPWRADAVDTRVYALSRQSQCYFGRLWVELAARRVSPYRELRVFDGDTPDAGAAIAFDAADIGEPDLGHIVEDRLLRSVLLQALASTEVELNCGQGLEAIEAGPGCVRVTLGDGTRLDADLVVGADGAESFVRGAVGIDVVCKDYAQRALVAHVETSLPHRETAWQRFLPGGPLAFLPLADGRSSIVWTNEREEAARLLGLSDDAFLSALDAAGGGALGQILSCTPRRSFPLELKHAARYTRPGIALIGDAAHAVHPLAGQGMNLGLRDAVVLANTLADALAAGEYPGDEFVLRRYARAQRAHNLGMQLAFDGISELFGSRVPGWTVPLRRFGMQAVNGIAPARRLLMRRAMGLDTA
jgi:ubiquinone biosynthesis UbiH/UbiF/VisC/COQ6 family hydroxylase